MCGPRQLFFQCGPETPKGWTLLIDKDFRTKLPIFFPQTVDSSKNCIHKVQIKIFFLFFGLLAMNL